MLSLLLLIIVIKFNIILVLPFSSPDQRATSSSPPFPFSSPPSSSLWLAWNSRDVQISIAETNNDILSLADLRYQEWITKDGDSANAGFRLATAEIYRDRKEDGSTVFLASIAPSDYGSGKNDRHRRSVVVGAAELTPIELKGVLIDRDNNDYDHYTGDAVLPLYITDVVTSKAHRRLGIGSILMKPCAMLVSNGNVLMTTFSLAWASHSPLWIVAFSFGLVLTIPSSSFVCTLTITGPSVNVILNGMTSLRSGPRDSNRLRRWCKLLTSSAE